MSTNVPTATCAPEARQGSTRFPFRLIDLIDDMCSGKDVFFRDVRVAGDVMTRDPQTLTLDDRVETGLHFMKNHKVRHIPVVDVDENDGRTIFVGVLSGRDIGRHLSPYVGKLGQEDTDRRGLRDPLCQVITRQPHIVSPGTCMTGVLGTMVEHRVDMVPVLDDGHLVGLVTSADIRDLFIRIHRIRQLCQQDPASQRRIRLVDLSGKPKCGSVFYSAFKTAEDMMTEHPVCLEEGDDLARAIELMQAGRFRHIPIVDKDRKLKGVLSDRNILRHLPGPRRTQPAKDSGFRTGLFDIRTSDPCLGTPVSQTMMLDVTPILPSHDIYDAATMMQSTRMDALVVTDEREVVQGILTVTDFMRALLATYEFGAQQPST